MRMSESFVAAANDASEPSVIFKSENVIRYVRLMFYTVIAFVYA